MMLSNGQLARAYEPWGYSSPLESRPSFTGLRRIEAAVAAQIADDMDFWNSIHDSNNQADSDWIRQRYGVSE